MKRSNLALWLILSLAFWTGATHPVEAAGEFIQQYPATATVRFSGTSTLHDFGGQLPAQPFLLLLSNGTWSGEADVFPSQMATASEGRDRNMHRMLDTNGFPRIHGMVPFGPIPATAGTNATLRLTIRDKTLSLPARITQWKETAQELTFHANWELSLKEYKLKPPSVIGVIRVGDRVKLEADVVARKVVYSPQSPLPPP